VKIRTGFVSNSSSSSFIIALDKKPKSVDDVQKLLFGSDFNAEENVEYYDYKLSQGKVADIVFNDINRAKKITVKNIDKDDYDYEIISNFMKKNRKKVIVQVSYADEDGGWGCVMEHSGVLENLNCIRISNH